LVLKRMISGIKTVPWKILYPYIFRIVLKNYKRDNYSRLGLEESSEQRQKANEAKRNLMTPAPICDQSLFFEDLIDNQEEVDFLLQVLPPLIRNDFLRMANGVSLSKVRRQTVIDIVKEILNENG